MQKSSLPAISISSDSIKVVTKVPVKPLGLVNPEVISLSGQSSAPKKKVNPKSKEKEEKKKEEDPKPKPKVVKKVHMAP